MDGEHVNKMLFSFPFGITTTVPEDWTEEQCQKYALEIMNEIINNKED